MELSGCTDGCNDCENLSKWSFRECYVAVAMLPKRMSWSAGPENDNTDMVVYVDTSAALKTFFSCGKLCPS